MTVATPLAIATFADSPHKNAILAELIHSAGHHLLGQWLADDYSDAALLGAAAWLIDIDQVNDDPRLDVLLRQTQAPLLFCDTLNHGDSRNPDTRLNHGVSARVAIGAGLDNIRQRLLHLGGELAARAETPARYMCLVGASTGGITPVKEFLQQLPKSLNMAIIYAQHIDANQLPNLIKVLSPTGFRIQTAAHHQVLSAGSVTLASPAQCLHIASNGTLQLRAQPWPGLFSPSITQLGLNLAQVYRERCSMAIFSGLDNDGSQAARFVAHRGGLVLAQDPSLAIADAMPRHTIATGCVSHTGTPKQLADALAQRLLGQPAAFAPPALALA